MKRKFSPWILAAVLAVLAVLVAWTFAVQMPETASAAVRTTMRELGVMTAPTCVGIGRYERTTGQQDPLVFDSCRGRYYRLTDSLTWEVAIPAIPDIPPTQAERAEWQRLTTAGLVGQ